MGTGTLAGRVEGRIDGVRRRKRRTGLRPRRDLLGRDGPAEVEALAQRAALLHEERPLLFGLDPLVGDDGKIDLSAFARW